MCFHFQQTKSITEIQQRFQVVGEGNGGIFNGFQHPQTPVITNLSPQRLQNFSWGIIPHWSRDHKIRKYTLNAKLETINEKPSFRTAKRCLVLADGFFEWQWLAAKGKQKQKYLITNTAQEVFAFAGLWDEWVDQQSGELFYTYAIVTTEAQGIMREIHNTKLRMPFVLKPDEEKEWLQGGNVSPFTNFLAQPVQ